MELALLVKNIAIVGAIVGVTYASQQPLFKTNTKNYTYSLGAQNTANPLKNMENWVHDNIYQKVVGSSAGSGGATVKPSPIASAQKEIETQKNNAVKNSVDSTKKYIAKKVLDILGVKAQNLGECKAN